MKNNAGPRRGRQAWTAVMLPAFGVPLAAAVAVLTINDQWTSWIAGLPALDGAQWRANVLLLEAALLVIAAPLAAVMLVANLASAHRVPARSPAALRAVAQPIVISATALSVVSALLLGRGTTGPITALVVSHVTLWAAALGFAGIGALAAVLFTDALDAAAAAIGIALFAAAAVFVAGPVLDDAPASVIGAALLISPVSGIASAADIDIFRTDTLYRLSPLAHMRVDYPSLPATVAAYLAVATACLLVTALRLDHRARHSSAERISL